MKHKKVVTQAVSEGGKYTAVRVRMGNGKVDLVEIGSPSFSGGGWREFVLKGDEEALRELYTILGNVLREVEESKEEFKKENQCG